MNSRIVAFIKIALGAALLYGVLQLFPLFVSYIVIVFTFTCGVYYETTRQCFPHYTGFAFTLLFILPQLLLVLAFISICRRFMNYCRLRENTAAFTAFCFQFIRHVSAGIADRVLPTNFYNSLKKTWLAGSRKHLVLFAVYSVIFTISYFIGFHRNPLPGDAYIRDKSQAGDIFLLVLLFHLNIIDNSYYEGFVRFLRRFAATGKRSLALLAGRLLGNIQIAAYRLRRIFKATPPVLVRYIRRFLRNTVKQYSRSILLVALTLSVRLVWMLLTDNCLDGDTQARLFGAFDWSRHPYLYKYSPWLPGHFYFLGSVILIFKDMWWAPRLAHLVFAVMTVIPFYFAVKEEFDEPLAFNSSVILALFPWHVFISSLTLSEPLFLFFLFTAFYSAIMYQKSLRVKYFVYCIVSIAIMELLRYEGWMFAGILIIWLFARGLKGSKLALWVFLSSVIPFIFLFKSLIEMGDPLWAIHLSDSQVLHEGSSIRSNIAAILDAGIIPSKVFLLLFFIGLYKSIKGPWSGARYWWIILIPPYLYELYKTANGTLQCNPRYFLSYALFSIPIVILGLSGIVKNKAYLRAIIISFGAIYLLGSGRDRLFVDDTNTKYDQGFKNMIAYSRSNIAGKRVLVDWSCGMHENDAFRAYSGIPDIYLEIYKNDSLENTVLTYSDPGLRTKPELNSTAFNNLIKQTKAQYLVLFRNSRLKSVLGFNRNMEEFLSCRYELIFNDGGYRIYKIQSLVPDS